MKTKVLEVRDRMTFIPVLCVEMKADVDEKVIVNEAQRYLLGRCGYSSPLEKTGLIMMSRLDGSSKARNHYSDWGDRTFATAHLYIFTNWATLKDGDVVDVEFILGETSEPKRSERETSPF